MQGNHLYFLCMAMLVSNIWYGYFDCVTAIAISQFNLIQVNLIDNGSKEWLGIYRGLGACGKSIEYIFGAWLCW